MSTPSILEGIDIARAMKDEEYRNPLPTEQRQALAFLSGSGLREDDQLEDVAKGLTAGTAGSWTYRRNDPEIL